jgi:hemolysin III
MGEKRQQQPEPWTHYTLSEEVANSVTHGIGALLSIAGLTLLVTLAVQQHNPLKIASFSIYGMSLVILHLASTLYHALRTPWVKRLFRIFDHCSIYLLIAGTYTPFLIIGLHDTQGFLLLGVVWGLAALGIIFQIAFKGWFGKLSLLPYLGMGWLMVIIFRKLIVNIPFNGFILLIAGGMAYMVGIIFYGWKKLTYHHAIWHLFVLAGSACHFFAILFYLLPEG